MCLTNRWYARGTQMLPHYISGLSQIPFEFLDFFHLNLVMLPVSQPSLFRIPIYRPEESSQREGVGRRNVALERSSGVSLLASTVLVSGESRKLCRVFNCCRKSQGKKSVQKSRLESIEDNSLTTKGWGQGRDGETGLSDLRNEAQVGILIRVTANGWEQPKLVNVSL